MTLIYSGDEVYGDEITSPDPVGPPLDDDPIEDDDPDWYGEAEHQADEARRRHYERKYGEEP